MINSLAVGLALGLIGIGIIGIVVSGIRNIINGKSEFKRITVMLLPVLVFVISFFLLGSFEQAGVATMSIMVILMIISILITGTRGTFKF